MIPLKRPATIASIAVCGLFLAAFAQAPKPPQQPRTGPGGAEYRHQRMRATQLGSGPQGYWLFEPAGPEPAKAPLIVFSHGWGAMEPNVYGAWIEHLVRRGNIVVYPLYQDSLRTPVSDFTPNAVAAVQDAVRRLQEEPGRVRPELARFALVGHSMGGIVSANLAALAEKSGLPRPRAVMCVEPAKTWARSRQIAVKLEDLGRIPKGTLLLAVVGDRDQVARDVDAKRIFDESTAIPLADKDYVILGSDTHGEPALLATHAAPSAPKPITGESGGNGAWMRRGADGERGVDAMDFYGTWKLFDGLADAAFYGKHREYALGSGPQQRYMGKWSDGVPVKEPTVTDRP